MKKEITTCDVCGEEVLEGRYCMDEGFSVNIPSPSGNIEVAVFADVLHQDICAPCMQTIYEKIFKKPVLSAIVLDELKHIRK